MGEELDIEDRIELIKERLHYRRMGMAQKTLPFLDFDAWLEEDLEWLLEVIEKRQDEIEERADKAHARFETIKEELLKLPDVFVDADKKIEDTTINLGSLIRSLQEAKRAVRHMRDELGLFDASSEVQLYAARKELDDVRQKLDKEQSEHQHTKFVTDSRIRSLEKELQQIRLENGKLQAQLDGLPPTWQERLVLNSKILPSWVTTGTKVRVKEGNVEGTVEHVDLEEVRIKTSSLGSILCPVEQFDELWRKA